MLITRAQHRTLVGYIEEHHVIPRCIGGSDDLTNLVDLTPEEHYVAHQLLVKMYPGNPRLLRAAIFMTAKRPGNKCYGWLRRRLAEAQSIAQTGSNNTQYGTRWIHNNILKESRRIPKHDQLPTGWCEGRKIHFERDCRLCGAPFLIQGKKQFCSNKCKSHARSPSNVIIDSKFDEMVEFFKNCRSIDKTLKHFGVTGSRAGNGIFSRKLKALGIRVRPRS